MIKLFEDFINENVYTFDEYEGVANKIKTALLEVVPEVNVVEVYMGSLNVDIIFEPKSEWDFNTWRNSNYVSLYIKPDGTITERGKTLFKSGFKFNYEQLLNITFRKAKAKSVDDMIKKLVDHAKKIMNEYK